LDTDTGAPPDFYSTVGQNWHFPNYNWDDMSSDGYEWWMQRFSTLGRYFHAIRVDHILGFFRIWRIPKNDASLRGYLFPSHGIHEDELRRNGIWDHDRLCRCQFKHSDVIAVFKELKMDGSIFIDFFTQPLPDEDGNKITFKSEFKLFVDVEKKVDEEVLNWDEFKHLEGRQARVVRQKIIEGLQILWGSVVFVRDIHNSSILYPRFNCSKSASFQDLKDEGWKKWIEDFAHDYFFEDRNTSLWVETANHRIGLIQSASRMFICGEDLGFVPSCVHPIMRAFGIPGQRIQTMPVSPDDRYMRAETFPYDCVAVRAVHDTATLRKEWMTTEEGKLRHYFYDILGMTSSFEDKATPAVLERVIWQHLDSAAMIATFQWQEWIALSESLKKKSPHHERVNIPDRFPHYWRYRMHMYVEDMLDEAGNRHVKEWNSQIRQMIRKSRRWLF
jgi:4-alpha-glucanotransferase